MTLEELKARTKLDQRGCWNWQGSVSGKERPYGQVWFDGKLWLAHRLSYHLFVKPIPDGLNVCHDCDNYPCINPKHLYAATQSVNMKDAWKRGLGANQNSKKTHCQYGHPLSGHNLYVSTRGHRVCRTCDTVRLREKRARLRGAQ